MIVGLIGGFLGGLIAWITISVLTLVLIWWLSE